ncbi:MAG: glycerophosphoryl diester phosphodiesterase [Actinomycetota bacterium]
MFVVAAALAAGALSATPAHAATPAPVVYAHRGGAGYAPENTLGAFRKTDDLFGDRGVWMELDTQATADNVLVVMHDDSVDRTTNCSGKVNALTYAQIAPCNAAESFAGWPDFEPVPTLEQVMTEARDKGWRLAIEIKDIPGEANFDPTGNKVATLLIALVRSTAFPLNDLIIQSFWPLTLNSMKRLSRSVQTLLLTSSTLPSAPQGVGIPATLNVVYTTLNRFTIASPDYTSKDFSKLTVTLAHLLGRKLVAWTVDDAATMNTLRLWAADGVITNRPDIAYATYG